MDNTRAQVTEKIQGATNVLVTVSSNPSVDQLTACLGLTLWLNKINKHATAVFSGDIPNALEFLQPEVTIEKNTDSLRDFIIALDKSKADKLRYKVEDRVVKIFITPYRTSLSANDLEFSQGDFNVDAIIALGVTKQEDLDNAIIAHGRILHDATVITINTGSSDGGIGSINWQDQTVSSLSELIYELGQTLDISQLDPQIATALLTGIVAETSRFSNSKTTSQTMSVSAALMKAGANQQLVANKLEEAEQAQVAVQENNSQAKEGLEEIKTAEQQQGTEVEAEEKGKPDDGTLEIDHEKSIDNKSQPTTKQEVEPQPEPSIEKLPTNPKVSTSAENQESSEVGGGIKSNQHIITEPPTLGGDLNYSAHNEEQEDVVSDSVDSLNLPKVDSDQLLDREPLGPIEAEENPKPQEVNPDLAMASADSIVKQPTEAKEQAQPTPEGQTLAELEQAVDSPHIDNLRDQVQDALKVGPEPDLKPTEALNAINVDLGDDQNKAQSTQFNPDVFELHDNEEGQQQANSQDLPPEVPPPIVPPDYLPPSPPTE